MNPKYESQDRQTLGREEQTTEGDGRTQGEKQDKKLQKLKSELERAQKRLDNSETRVKEFKGRNGENKQNKRAIKR